MENQRNLILAVLLTIVLIFGWEAGMRYLYPEASRPRPVASTPAPAADPASTAKPTREGGLSNPADVALEVRDLRAALNPAGRVPIVAPGLSGSLNLTGALVDDLVTNRHTATADKASGPARIFSPAGTPAQHFAQFGWVGANAAAGGAALPTAQTVWTAPAGARLTPSTPVTLTWANGQGQTFAITFSIDADYLITAKQVVANAAPTPLRVQPFALINRTDKTASVDTWTLHSGPFGAFDGSVSFGPNYADVLKTGEVGNAGKPNWLGFTDIYWMSAVIPDAGAQRSDFRALGGGVYRADLLYAEAAIAPGKQLTHTTRLFAGAKESDVLDRYESAGVTNFGKAIDWGWFFWFEKPIFWLLKALFKTVGNFGVAIILLTLIVRGIMFPIAQRQFASMASMRAIQPKLKALQERYKDDKPKLQEETMRLYKEEGVNPLAGCLPIFLQIPVFFALYKVLTLAVEMRHQPFALWIHDLSAPDPLHILNLFGLLPFTPPAFLGIGLLALLLGFTMWLQFKLNPAAPDPVQQQVFAIMPWMMMFVMAPFAAGLLIYWITSNILTIAQQKFLYSRHPQMKAMVEKERADVAAAAKRK
ncbi:membrane protein insertase YidC [Novosphingobium piscinae]|uniref:Membrane protein insertase YidC n=1 Tax=Novosphingobium piscinae TaxID=1507448 RepID=A0A7X1FY23_9SPHN|nr:membrane protein insertase YidC [Novosphingobium piscinae]